VAALPVNYDGWKIVGTQIGKGGQGTVYCARSPQRVSQIGELLEALRVHFRSISNEYGSEELAKCIVSLGSPDRAEHLGALKEFEIREGEEGEKSIGRLEKEIQALQRLRHPAILKLLHANPSERFIVTEYHPNGTLDKHLDLFRGNVLESLKAFRPLVDAVRLIHEQGAIHRDIKTSNIFVATDGRLLLGDFGIVFFLRTGTAKLRPSRRSELPIGWLHGPTRKRN
jgi:serine/threonine protein kinase